jgi:HlyD family secretion protein
MSSSPRHVRRRAASLSARRNLQRCNVYRRNVYRRNGNTFTFAIGSIAVAAALSLAGWWTFGRGGGDDTPEFLTTTVTHGPYDFVVIEQGTVESARNVDLRCQVRSRGGGGGGGDRGGGGGLGGSSTTILEVVPEGTMVNEGEVVVELDSSSLQLEENAQKILVSTRESQLAQAENALKAAEIAKLEYLLGLFVSQEKLIQSELYLAEQAYRQAEQAVVQSKSLLEKNIITALQLETAEVARENAKNGLDNAQTKLRTLRELTKQKELTVLEANIASAKANVSAQQQGKQLEEDKLKDIQDQIGKCTIKAPQAGQVVYANETDMFRGSSSSQFIVTAGAMVRERQVIIRLPNANEMQVRATVNEARVTLIREGLPVTIRVDALKDEMIEGEVIKVNQYAEASSYSSGNIKKYATLIRIKNPTPELRVGMNAEVRIHVERKPDSLQVPVQTLAELKGHYFSLVKNGDQYETREVKIGSTNDKVATIESGLKEGDEVVMNPRSAGNLLKLPNMPDPTPVVMDEIKRNDSNESPLRVASTGDKGGGPDGGKKGFASKAPADFVATYLESDADKDGKLSKDEMSKMDDRMQQRLSTADTNGDGFLDRRELLVAANAMMQKMRGGGKGGEGGGRGGFGGGRRGGNGGEGGPNGGAGPAGGE